VLGALTVMQCNIDQATGSIVLPSQDDRLVVWLILRSCL